MASEGGSKGGRAAGGVCLTDLVLAPLRLRHLPYLSQIGRGRGRVDSFAGVRRGGVGEVEAGTVVVEEEGIVGELGDTVVGVVVVVVVVGLGVLVLLLARLRHFP